MLLTKFESAPDRGVLMVLPPTGDDVVAFIEFRQ